MPFADPEKAKASAKRYRAENREAYNEYMRWLRKKDIIDDVDQSKEENPHDPRYAAPHGTVQRYRRFKCKCGPCTTANSEAQAKYRARRREREAKQDDVG